MPTAERREAARLFELFRAGGAQPVDAPVLLPSETLLDLYGEDLRARAYVTNDPEHGEIMLRPDFTVPVVQMHMTHGAEPARYTYQGAVFRKQEPGTSRATEYWQVGLEVFDRKAPAQAEAAVFCAVRAGLDGVPCAAVTGDMGVLLAAIEGLTTSARRKAALRRHIWRPKRFATLLARFCGQGAVSAHRAALAGLAPEQVQDQIAATGAVIGLRSPTEIAARVAVLTEDAALPPIPSEQAALLDHLFDLAAPSDQALVRLRDLAVQMPAIGPALDQMEARLCALDAAGVGVEKLAFNASFGRAAMEYYDGFVFGFSALDQPDWPLLASGGRYDALTRVLGQGGAIPAVGAVIRPGLVAQIRGEPGC